MNEADKGALRHVEAEAARLQAAGADQEAVQLCFQGLNRFGDSVGLLTPLAQIFLKHGDLNRAEGYLERLTALAPQNPEFLATYANVLTALERNDEAVVAHRKVLSKDALRQTSLVNLGMLLVKKQKADEAIPLLARAVVQKPQDAQARTWLGFAHSAQGNLSEAIDCYESVYRDLDHRSAVAMPLAIAYRDLGRLSDANRVLQDILTQDPEEPIARFSLAQHQLLAGDFEQGFGNYESRWERPDSTRPEINAPLWQGEALDGKTILVHDEQGFGDCIQFCRFLKPLQGLGARVLFQVRPKLRELMAGVEGYNVLVAPGEVSPDYYCPLMSLPLRLGLTADTVPDAPYLTVPEDRRAGWLKRLGRKTGLRIGLVWQGDPASQAETGRSVPYSLLRSLFDLPGCSFILLQKFHGRDELLSDRLPGNVLDLGEEVDNGGDAFVDTAAVMANLDIVVTSDTAAAHLAGAMGIPCYVLLKSMPEWRWMLDRPDSPWYRNMTLLRQPERGNWQAVVDELRDLLVTNHTDAGQT